MRLSLHWWLEARQQAVSGQQVVPEPQTDAVYTVIAARAEGLHPSSKLFSMYSICVVSSRTFALLSCGHRVIYLLSAVWKLLPPRGWYNIYYC